MKTKFHTYSVFLFLVACCVPNAFAAAGAIDPTFTTVAGTDVLPSVIVPLADGKSLVGGTFVNYGGTGRKSVARLNSDGTVDTSFTLDGGASLALAGNVFNGEILDLEVQSDGKIIVAGSFTQIGNQSRTNLARLNIDGTVDLSFVANAAEAVKDTTILPDGRILAVGSKGINGVTKNWNIFRLSSAGVVDNTFSQPDLAAFGNPSAVKRLANGKILAVANYSGPSGLRFQVVRLNEDGTTDPGFALGTAADAGGVARFVVAADGKIMVTGGFNTYNGIARPKLVRLNEDGTVDETFQITGGTLSVCNDAAIQSDGKMLVTGSFTGGKSLVRLGANGALDATYAPGIGAGVGTAFRVAFSGDRPLVTAQVITFVPTVTITFGVWRLTAEAGGAPTIATPPVPQTVTEGGTAIFKVAAGGVGPFTYEWTRGGTVVGATETLQIDSVVAATHQGSYSVKVSNASGNVTSTPVQLTVLPAEAGRLFRDSLPIPGANSAVHSIERTTGGKLLVAGSFNSFTGTNRNRLARLEPNAQIDLTFDTANSLNLFTAYGASAQTDGRVIAAGNISANYANLDHLGALRFSATGAIDTTFNATGVGGDDQAFALKVAPDNRIYLSGFVGRWNGTLQGNLFRLTADGALDASFNATLGGAFPNGLPRASDLALRPDEKLFAVGGFTSVRGTPRGGAVLLNVDGSLDTSFVPVIRSPISIRACALQPDGKLLVGGSFNIDGTHGVIRLNPDGTPDNAFNPLPSFPDISGEVYDIALQSDGKILIGGFFDGLGTAKNLARLNPNGTFDESFQSPRPNGAVNTVCVTPENTMFIGGEFTEVDGQRRTNFARINIGPYDTAPKNPVVITRAPQSQRVTAGNAVTFSVETTGTGPLQYRWRYQGALIPGERGPSLVLPNIQVAQSGVYTVDIVNAISSVRSEPAVLIVNPPNPQSGDRDMSLRVNLNDVTALALQADHKIIVAHALGINRILEDGTIDEKFAGTINIGNRIVTSMLLLPDGKILLGGSFDTIAGQPRAWAARLNSNGTVDMAFQVQGTATAGNVPIQGMALQSDGKIVAVGTLSGIEGQTRNGIARLNPNGSLDGGFAPNAGAGASVTSVAIQPDQKILVGGFFRTMNGQPRPGIARLNSDGSLDGAFNPGTGIDNDMSVNSIIVQPDNKILISGPFNVYNGVPRAHVARVTGSGGLDTSFDPGTGPNFSVNRMALETDGRVMIGGQFTSVSGSSRNSYANLNPGGSLDTAFITEQATGSAFTSAIVLQDDNKVIVGGHNLWGRFFIGARAEQLRLGLALTQGRLRFEWTPPAVLQSSTTLQPNSWTDVPGTPPLEMQPSGGGRYFRLIQRP